MRRGVSQRRASDTMTCSSQMAALHLSTFSCQCHFIPFVSLFIVSCVCRDFLKIAEEAKGGIAVHCKGEKWHNVSHKWPRGSCVRFIVSYLSWSGTDRDTNLLLHDEALWLHCH